jgi:hypothetical protein
MSATTVAQVEDLLHRGLNQGIRLYNVEEEFNEGMKLSGNKITSKEQLYEIAAYGGLDLPSRTLEYGAPQTTSQAKVYGYTWRHKKWMLTFQMSNEAYTDEQGHGIIRGYAKELAGVFQAVDQIDAADTFLNLVDDGTNNPGPYNAEPLAYASHALRGAGTYSNLLDPAETASPDAVRKLVANLKKTKAHKGRVAPIIGPVVIMCSADDELIFQEIWQSIGKAHEESNTKNVLKSMISDITGNPYATNANRFGVRIANNSKHKGFEMVREPFTIAKVEYIKNDSYEVTAKMRKVRGWMDWRGYAFSLA